MRDSPGAARDDVVEELAALGVEAGVGLVEQEQAGIAGERHRDREAAALPHRQPPVHHVGLAGEAEPLERGVRIASVTGGGAGREVEVLANGEVVVTEGLVTHEGEVTPSPLAVDREVVVEDHGFARIQGNEARKEPQQRGLARAVGAGEKHDLTGGRIEVDSG